MTFTSRLSPGSGGGIFPDKDGINPGESSGGCITGEFSGISKDTKIISRNDSRIFRPATLAL